MKHSTTLLLFLTSFFAFAQNEDYRLFRDNVQYLYGDAEDEIDFGMKLNGDCDSTYAHMPNSCSILGVVNAYRSSFAGFEVCQGGDTTVLRLNGGRLVELLPRTSVGQSWPVTIENNLQIFAKVDSVRRESFLGITDSVKYISFHGETPEDPTLSSIRIGKTTGLLNAVYFWNFLVCREEVPINGLSDPRAGLQYATAPDFLEPDIGQEIHFEEVIREACDTCSTGSYFQTNQYQLTLEDYTVSENGNLWTYLYVGSKLSSRTIRNASQTVTDTILQEDYAYTAVINPREFDILSQQPGAMVPYLREGDDGQLSNFRNTTTPLSVEESDCFGEYRRMGIPYDLRNETYSTFTDVPNSFTYLAGTGIRQFERASIRLRGRQIVYFKDNVRECGSPYNFDGIVSINTLPLDHTISIFPNPTNGQATVRLPAGDQYEVSILDLHGRKLVNHREANGEVDLNLQDLPVGVYVVTITKGGKLRGRRRLVLR